jgi:two-component system LytT family response regulator
MAIRVLIVDDEPLARQRIRDLLAAEPDVTIVAEALSGSDALAAIQTERPDLVFLDIQIPELDGFAVVEAIPPDRLPQIIFITAYDQYALKAFEIHALDYLLKPFEPERFRKALQRARQSIQLGRVDQGLITRLQGLLREVGPAPTCPRRIMVKDRGKIRFVDTAEVLWIEAAGNYLTLHTDSGEHLVRQTMQEIERLLDPGQFVRTHRSCLVNLNCIKELVPMFHGESLLVLRNGQQVPLSRTYREKVKAMITGW